RRVRVRILHEPWFIGKLDHQFSGPRRRQRAERADQSHVRRTGVFPVEPMKEPTMKNNLSLIFAMLLFATTAAYAQFTYTVTNGTITITGYTGCGAVGVIPDTINGLP